MNTHGGDAEAVAEALGLGRDIKVRLDFSVNVNPLGPPPRLTAILASAHEAIGRYPAVHAEEAAAALAAAHGVERGSVIVGNGSTEIFSWLVQAFRPKRPAWIVPTYTGYAEVCEAAGARGLAIFGPSPDTNFRITPDLARNADADMLFLCSPNNPTGATLSPDEILALALDNLEKRIVMDESFVDFLPEAKKQSLISDGLPGNLIVVKSLTKFFAIPGLRIGMACAAPETIARLREVGLPWSVNAIAQAACRMLYDQDDYIRTTRHKVKELRDDFFASLEQIPDLRLFASDVNFFLLRLPEGWGASRMQAELLKRGILIRACADFAGLDDSFCRLAVRPREENEELAANMAELLCFNPKPKRKTTPAIMVLGTASSAGKSVVATALCRYFARKGARVAPFKAQNMALNSFVTPDGGEMGRAQVTQAAAAGIEPHTDMNPVLLKPMGDAGCQVVVNGRPTGNVTAKEYYSHKTHLRQTACAAYDRISAKYDLMILEGAGSPAEINLRDKDFVNMAMAEHARARVVLVADIDRGGVFASILGTVSLLTPRERRLLSGIIINKFRGDPELLEPGIREIEAMTGIPVLGVLPYLTEFYFEEEDSLGLEGRGRQAGAHILDVAVIRLPRISNYTDFLELERMSGVRVRYVSSPRTLGNPDMLIIPGSKNTRADLRYLHDSGFSDRVHGLTRRGVPVLGICGGYQMLGETVKDPDGVEGEPGETRGLALLPIQTALEKGKELAQVSGATTESFPFAKSGTPFRGYEIHAGKTFPIDPARAPLIIAERRGEKTQEACGTCSPDGLVFGCYVHGLFDEREIRSQMLEWLCRRKGLDVDELDVAGEDGMESVFERLADTLEAHVNMSVMEEWIGRDGEIGPPFYVTSSSDHTKALIPSIPSV